MWRKKKDSEIEYVGALRLNERLAELFGEGDSLPNLLEDVPNTFKKEKMFAYHLTPRLDRFDDYEILKSLGNAFTLIYERPVASKNLHLYAVTPMAKTTLEPFFEVSIGFVTTYPFVAVLKPSRDWLEEEYCFKDLPSLASSLPPGSGIAYSVIQDEFVQRRVRSKKARADKTLFDARRGDKLPPEGLEVVSRRAREKIYLTRILAMASTDYYLEDVLNLLEVSLPRFRSNVMTFTIEDEEKYQSLFIPRKTSFADRLFGMRFMTVTEEALSRVKLFPDPSKHPVRFHRGSKFRSRVERKSGFSIGTVDGEDFYLSPEDFFRHAYIVGQTGSGKTNLLKLLARKLHESGHCVIVIDPHGDMAEELAITTPDAIFFHPTRSPFGLNPLKLPESDNRDLAITKSIDVLMNLFTNIFHLPETAINVRYILQTVTRQLYKLGAEPTLAGVYKIVSDIYVGADIGISDENFREHEKLLKNMPDQSFISTLGRLQSFAADSTLRRMTNTTTVDIAKFVSERRMVLFSIPQAELGFINTTLLCSTLVLHIYYTMLQLSKKSPGQHVFVVVDEFQNLQSLPILTQILSEARKFGLHLILAHQYVEQLSDEVFQAAINNAGVKFVFQVSGDVEKFRILDPAFKDEILKTVVSLPTGQCMVKIATSPEEAGKPPFILSVRYYDYPQVRELEDACTKDYDPPDVELSLELVNPIFKYIDLPFPPRQKILYGLYKEGGSAYAQIVSGYVPHINEHGFNRILNRLAAEGYLIIEKKKDGRFLKLTDKFLREFEKIAPSEGGKKLARAAALYYLEKGYYVAPTKNVPKEKLPRPDFVLIPYEGYFLDYSRTVDVEIEASPEKNVHHQLVRTFSKDTPSPERHVWCTEENKSVVLEYAKYSNKPTKIFVLTAKGVRVYDLTKKLPSKAKGQEEKQLIKSPETSTPVSAPTSGGQPKSADTQELHAETVETSHPTKQPVQAATRSTLETVPKREQSAQTRLPFTKESPKHEERASSVTTQNETASIEQTGPAATQSDKPEDRFASVLDIASNSKALLSSSFEQEETDEDVVELKPSPKVRPNFVKRAAREELSITKLVRMHRDILTPVVRDGVFMSTVAHVINKAAIPDDEVRTFIEIALKHLDFVKDKAGMAKRDPRTFAELLYEVEFGKEAETEPTESTTGSEPIESGPAESVLAEDELTGYEEEKERGHDTTDVKEDSEESIETSEEIFEPLEILETHTPPETEPENAESYEPSTFDHQGLSEPEAPIAEEEPIEAADTEVPILEKVATDEYSTESVKQKPAKEGNQLPTNALHSKEGESATPPPEVSKSAEPPSEPARRKKRKKLLYEIMYQEVPKTMSLTFRERILMCTEHVYGNLKTALEFVETYGGRVYLEDTSGRRYSVENAPPGTYTLTVETETESKKFSVKLS